jgi:Holliday junction resolvasome RuvABC endonuclease subunit
MNSIGIDPGTVNIGVAITSDTGELLFSEIFSLKDCGGLERVVKRIAELCDKYEVKYCGMERFVPFKNLFTKVTEDILILIGALWITVRLRSIPTELYRSIEWKPALCKHLVKESGFNNPSTSFDKIFSRAVASHITKTKIKNDHISDAIGLSSMWKLQNIR